MTSDDEQFLQDIVCGDAFEHDPASRVRLDSNPRLLARLGALRAAQQELTALGEGVDSLGAEAARLVAPSDRARLAAVLRSRPRPARNRWLLLAGLAAAVVVIAMLYQGQDSAPAPDGRLGGATPVTLHREGDRWRLVVDDALPPGTSYHLRLELADGTTSTATAESRAWEFPDAWNQSVSRMREARLVIEWDDGTGLFVRRVLRLP